MVNAMSPSFPAHNYSLFSCYVYSLHSPSVGRSAQLFGPFPALIWRSLGWALLSASELKERNPLSLSLSVLEVK